MRKPDSPLNASSSWGTAGEGAEGRRRNLADGVGTARGQKAQPPPPPPRSPQSLGPRSIAGPRLQRGSWEGLRTMAPGSQLAGLSRGTGWERVFYSGPAAPLGLRNTRGLAGAGGGVNYERRRGCGPCGREGVLSSDHHLQDATEEGATESLSRGAPRVTWGWGHPPPPTAPPSALIPTA